MFRLPIQNWCSNSTGTDDPDLSAILILFVVLLNGKKMDTKKTSRSKLFSMNGGQGPLSYAKNSSYQRMGLEWMKRLVKEEINKDNLHHYVHSSYTLHWLSKIPEEVEDKSSLAWNKSRIHYGGSSKEVEKAYATQFARDFTAFLKVRVEEVVHGEFMALLFVGVPIEVNISKFAKDFKSFLKVRAEEVVAGGMMALLLVGTPMEVNISKCDVIAALELMGSTLMDMAKMGLVDEAKVDSFNLPVYMTTLVEVKALVESNGCFKIEKIQEIARPVTILCKQDVKKFVLFIRAWAEPCIKSYFGGVITDELFIQFTEKLSDSRLGSDPDIVPMSDIVVLLKCRSQ